MSVRRLVCLLICVAAWAGSASAGAFEDAVRARWRGAWVILDIESYSDCIGGYHNNDVSGQFVSSRGGRKFELGELAKVDRVQVKRKKAELLISIPARVLVARQDGPFTLYDPRYCAIELEVAVPREVIQHKDVDAVDRLLTAVAERFATEEEARESALWNGREGDRYPADYDVTLARHARWRAEQTNLAIEDRIESALAQVEELAEQVDDDPIYLEGFAAGTQRMRDWNENACGPLLGRGFDAIKLQVPEERAEDETWCEGFDDGQRLVYSIGLVRRLPRCFVELPPLPEGS